MPLQKVLWIISCIILSDSFGLITDYNSFTLQEYALACYAASVSDVVR